MKQDAALLGLDVEPKCRPACVYYLLPARWISGFVAPCSISLVALPVISTLIKGSPMARLPRDQELHLGFLLGTDGTQWSWRAPGRSCWGKKEGCSHVDVAVWGEEPTTPSAMTSPSKWRQFYSSSREWFANVLIPSFFTCMPPSCPCDIWMKPNWSEGVGVWGCYVGWGNLCVFWSLSYRLSLSGFSPGTHRVSASGKPS